MNVNTRLKVEKPRPHSWGINPARINRIKASHRAVDSALVRQIEEIERTFSDRWEW